MYYEELYDMDLNEFDENEELKERFKIDTPELASWACKVVNEENERFEEYKTMVDAEINILKAKLEDMRINTDRKTSYLKYKLNEYLDIAPSKKTKTQVKLVTPHGSLVRTLPKWTFISLIGAKDMKSDTNLLEWCKTEAPEYVKIAESVDWAGLKKRFSVDGNGVIDKETGEFIECIGAELTEEKFEVK